jgi:hypothetical protein
MSAIAAMCGHFRERDFAADEPETAWSLAKAAHPEDDGSFIIYVPREKVARIYDYQR